MAIFDIFNGGRGQPATMSPELAAALITQPASETRITEDDVRDAADTLRKYKGAKANLEARIIEDELWWELRHWEAVERTGANRTPRLDCKGRPIVRGPQPTSAWLFNSIASKHADAMDNFPEPVVLPREPSDEQSAKTLSAILPVIMEANDFASTYDLAWWEKLKHGTAVYGVFWDQRKDNGLGDVDIRMIDLLNIYWEPGITNLQKSRNIFTTELVDNDVLEAQYPQLVGKLGKYPGGIDMAQYLYDTTVDTSDKSVVVDWYYKRQSPNGTDLLHYAKFVGDTLLYASENDPEYRERGFYDHGKYPFVMDVLYPEKGTPVGFGYVSICKDPQLYIDQLFGNILEYSKKATKPRHFVSNSTGVNEKEYEDWDKPVVHVEGSLDDTRVRQITLDTMPSIYANIIQMKIDELKETSANRDVSNGGSTSGVTAASAIAALQEAGNKLSRDMIASSYRADSEITKLVIELLRQFYDIPRTFRITAPNGTDYSFVEFSNAGITNQPQGVLPDGTELIRQPVFDLKVAAQKRNPFARMEQNERAKELYGMGFFDPNRAQEAMGALSMMDFEGIDKVKEHVMQGQTLLNICNQLQAQLQAIMAGLAGQPVPGADMQGPSGGTGAPPADLAPSSTGGDQSVADGIMRANTPMTSYGQRLAQRSKPSVEGA